MLPFPHQSHSVRHGHGICCHSHIKATSKPQHTSSWSWHTLSFLHQNNNILRLGHGIRCRSHIKATTYYIVVMAYLVVPRTWLRRSHNIPVLRRGHVIPCYSHIKTTSKPQHTTSWSCPTLSFPHQSHNVLRRGHGIRCRSQIKATIYNVVAMTYLVVPTT